MRSLLLLIVCLVFPLINFAQTHFENGYFIDNNGNKTEALIKNLDWNNNPQSFEYKLYDNSEIQSLTLQNTQEVVIPGKIKYIRHLVKVKQAQSRDLYFLSRSRQPDFTSETVFLKLLVEGKASLFLYTQANEEQYFFSLYDIKAEPLVYHKYLTTNNTIAENNEYKQTLFNFLQCEDIPLEQVENLKYTDKSLVDFFVKYNECIGTDFINYNKNRTKLLINLSARIGVKFSSLEIANVDHPTNRTDTDYGYQTSFQFGIEAEFVLPFNNHKWAVIIEPTYQSYKAETVLELDKSQSFHTRVDYSSIDVPLGIRHFFYLNNTSKLFVNSSLVMAFDLNSIIYRGQVSQLIVAPMSTNMAFGVGFNYNNRFSIEARYGAKRDILTNYNSWRSNYNSSAIILGYRFL